MLHPLMLASLRHGGIERVVGLRRAEVFSVSGAEPGDRRAGQRDFRGRGQFDPCHRPDRSLAFGIEMPCALQNVAKEVQPHGMRAAGWKNIDESASCGEISMFDNGRSPGESRFREPEDKLFDIDRPADLGDETAPGNGGNGRNPLRRGV